MGLFSTNEIAEDIATADLKYLLVPFLLADLQAQTTARDVAARRQLLEAALQNFTR